MSQPLSYWMYQRDRRQQLDSAATSNDAVRLQERRGAEVFYLQVSQRKSLRIVAFPRASLSCKAFSIDAVKFGKIAVHLQAAIKQAELGGKKWIASLCSQLLILQANTTGVTAIDLQAAKRCVVLAFLCISWFSTDLCRWPPQAFGCVKRAASCETGPELGYIHRCEKGLSLKSQELHLAKTSGSKTQLDNEQMKDRISAIFCETWLKYDIWDKESLCADGSCSTRGGGPTHSNRVD